MMPAIVVFDVIETLLDLTALEPYFVRVFGDDAARQQWFQRVLKTALTQTVTGAYQDFGKIASASLEMTGMLHGITVGDDEKAQLREALRDLPPHADVPGGLGLLADAGVRLAALSNTPRSSSASQLQSADLATFFELILSADDVRRLKPAPEPYRYAADRMGVSTAEMWMVAAHGWDLEGARQAGCMTAFVQRPGHVLNPLAALPDIQGQDLKDVARQILTFSHR